MHWGYEEERGTISRLKIPADDIIEYITLLCVLEILGSITG
jgi:hypothetical protein